MGVDWAGEEGIQADPNAIQCQEAQEGFLQTITMTTISWPINPFTYATGTQIGMNADVTVPYTVQMRSCGQPVVIQGVSGKIQLTFRLSPSVVRDRRWGYGDTTPYRVAWWEDIPGISSQADRIRRWTTHGCKTFWSRTQEDIVTAQCDRIPSSQGSVMTVELVPRPNYKVQGAPSRNRNAHNIISYTLLAFLIRGSHSFRGKVSLELAVATAEAFPESLLDGQIALVSGGEGPQLLRKPRDLLTWPKEHGYPGEETVGQWFQASAGAKMHICHSLEDEISGVMLVGKRKSVQQLKEQFQQHQVRRSYEGVVFGWPSWDAATLDSPVKGGRPKTFVRQLRRGVWPATFGGAQKVALVEAWTMVGRTHQVQDHLLAAGHPIVGDRRNSVPRHFQLPSFRVFLHLKKLELEALDLPEDDFSFAEYVAPEASTPRLVFAAAAAPLQLLKQWGAEERHLKELEALLKSPGAEERFQQWTFLVDSGRLQGKDCLQIFQKFPESLGDFLPQEVWSNEDFFVLRKPFNRLLYHKKRLPKDVPLVEWVKDTYVDCRLCHRLDYGTSGALLLAKTTRGAQLSLRWFSTRQVKKVYHALVRGVPRWRRETFTWPLQGKEAETAVEVLRQGRLGDFAAPVALLEVRPATGRTHQIRQHLAMAGHPIIGDEEYGNSSPLDWYRLCLHSSSLTLPLEDGEVTIEVPHPFSLEDEDALKKTRARSWTILLVWAYKADVNFWPSEKQLMKLQYLPWERRWRERLRRGRLPPPEPITWNPLLNDFWYQTKILWIDRLIWTFCAVKALKGSELFYSVEVRELVKMRSGDRDLTYERFVDSMNDKDQAEKIQYVKEQRGLAAAPDKMSRKAAWQDKAAVEALQDQEVSYRGGDPPSARSSIQASARDMMDGPQLMQLRGASKNNEEQRNIQEAAMRTGDASGTGPVVPASGLEQMDNQEKVQGALEAALYTSKVGNLPPGWEEYVSEEHGGRVFYVFSQTGDTTWERPVLLPDGTVQFFPTEDTSPSGTKPMPAPDVRGKGKLGSLRRTAQALKPDAEAELPHSSTRSEAQHGALCPGSDDEAENEWMPMEREREVPAPRRLPLQREAHHRAPEPGASLARGTAETLPKSQRCFARGRARATSGDLPPSLGLRRTASGTDPSGAPRVYRGEAAEPAGTSGCYPMVLIQMIISYCGLSGTTAAQNQMLILLVSYQKEAGGFEFGPRDIGLIQNIGALGLLSSQLLLYPKITKNFGFLKTFLFGFCLAHLSYGLFPIYGIFADPDKYGAWRYVPMGGMQFFYTIGTGCMYPTAFAFINRAAEGLNRGAVNGWTNSVGAMCRGAFPPLFAVLLSVSNRWGPMGKYVPLYIITLVGVACVAVSMPGLRIINERTARTVTSNGCEEDCQSRSAPLVEN
ncbi:unnamed protein product [Effrenium voratum]|nr:unnamed protein product [Effrenium voratum]